MKLLSIITSGCVVSSLLVCTSKLLWVGCNGMASVVCESWKDGGGGITSMSSGAVVMAGLHRRHGCLVRSFPISSESFETVYGTVFLFMDFGVNRV